MIEPQLNKHDIFDEPTTYKNDYRKFGWCEKRSHKWPRDRSEPTPKPSPPFKRIDGETFIPLREGSYIPFNLLWEKKPITGTNPADPFHIPEKPVDTEKDEVMKTRPRLYMSPAVSMDDVPDPKMRKLLVAHMYTTEWHKAEEEAASPISKRAVPNTTMEFSNAPVSLHIDLYPPIPQERLETCRSWDEKQNRASVDPTRTFWIDKGPEITCGACDNPYKGLVTRDMKDKIAHLIKTERLRMAHDKLCPTYEGYKPELSKGVSLEKSDLPVTHPFLSVSQALTSRYNEDQIHAREEQE